MYSEAVTVSYNRTNKTTPAAPAQPRASMSLAFTQNVQSVRLIFHYRSGGRVAGGGRSDTDRVRGRARAAGRGRCAPPRPRAHRTRVTITARTLVSARLNLIISLVLHKYLQLYRCRPGAGRGARALLLPVFVVARERRPATRKYIPDCSVFALP
ncbi:hypothetical protein EVAR_39346_1 [Eumeta japonica]|uniref:Uncharacterized protein n=1 Tax=Eumeta variegata TaxID=151549 RepID=A0A4C1WN53_EUMVA|nr:hypothetical protein EVAR_39346_1 [Eumeta japonica]